MIDTNGGTTSAVRSVNLADPFVPVRVVSSVAGFAIGERTIVINPTLTGVTVDAPGANLVPPFSSRTLRSVALGYADLLVLVEPPESATLERIRTAPGWRHHSEINSGARPSDQVRIPLWRSSQVDIGVVTIVPANVPGQTGSDVSPLPFRVKLSIWYAESGTDCGIHDEHEFMEIHTQIAGSGHMQKFLEDDEATLYEDELMTPGYTTGVPYCEVTRAEGFKYPWHRYYAETDCMWLALEYWPDIAEGR